jgi:hypothetical protein
MRGHEALIEMRLKGRAKAVCIGTDKESAYLSANWPSLGLQHAFVNIEPADRLVDLDLRFLVGLAVHIDGCDEKRVVSVFEAAKAAGAVRVFASVFNRTATGEFQTVRMLDSEELMTWPT